MAKRRAASVEKDDHISSALQAMGLKYDAGWVDELAAHIRSKQPDFATSWLEFSRYLAEAPSADPLGWPEAQARTLHLGVMHLVGTEIEFPPVGSDNTRSALRSAGPASIWLDDFAAKARQIGQEEICTTFGRLFQAAMRSNVALLNRPGTNRNALWAMIWASLPLNSKVVVERLRQLAIWSIEHKTHQAQTVGVALAVLETEDAAAALRSIEQAAKRPSPKERFASLAIHVERRLGISEDQTTEQFIPDCGMGPGGVRQHTFPSGASITLQVIPDGSVESTWCNAAGKSVKSPPADVKRDHAAEVKELAAVAKDVVKVLQAQRDRLDRLMALPREWGGQTWRERYLNHPLVGLLARRLIWEADGEAFIPGTDDNGITSAVGGTSRIRLWHPARVPPAEVLVWRERLNDHQITQPFKQAHREVYLLTDAERRTEVYSNRFAAHVIRQHQFKSLCLARGWKCVLRLVYDGDYRPASKELPAYGIRAEFWTDGAGEQLSHAGTYMHLSTDQVRFYPLGAPDRPAPNPLPLDQVPALAFSEIMRDVDLFVGVASVGNDPTWQDGGPEGRYRDYWHNYSFGELSATAKTRHDVLQSLLPRLKIKDRATLTERFLIIRGQLRTYKIHLGSGNILMEPNDQYLCMVQSRGGAAAGDQNLFLPFEGDQTLAVILSKAFLLAADDKISDLTITRQIQAK